MRSRGILFVICLSSSLTLFAQSVGINTISPDPSTAIDIKGKSQIKHNSSSNSPQLNLLEQSSSDYSRLFFSNNTLETEWTLAGRPNVDTASSAFNIYLRGKGNILSLRGNGKVGINVGSPTDGLHISVPDGNDAFRAQINGNTRMRLFANGGTSFGTNNVGGTPDNGIYVSGNTGLGVSSPTEKLEVDGAVVVGTTTGIKPGTIRYHNNDFQGYDGSKWVSLTKGGGEWGYVPDRLVTERHRVEATNLTNNSRWGHSLSSESEVAIVGARNYDMPGPVGGGEGAAFIFIKSGDQWIEQTRINASDLQSGDNFGYAVAVQGDYVFVGAPRAGSSDQGAVYIFHKSGNSWSEVGIINASDGQNGDYFGEYLDVDGNYLIVGAPKADVGGVTNSGAAYVYYNSGGTWTQQAKIFPANPVGTTSFPSAVAIDGTNIVCGRASSTVNGNANQGSAFIFERSGSSWIEKQEIFIGSNGGVGDNFGYSVDIDGNNIIVGARYQGLNGNSSGRADLFQWNGSNWNFTDYLKPSDIIPFDSFGESVSISGDNIIVGCSQHDLNLNAAGAAYHYQISGSKANLQHKFIAAQETQQALFGTRVSIYGSTVAITSSYYGASIHFFER